MIKSENLELSQKTEQSNNTLAKHDFPMVIIVSALVVAFTAFAGLSWYFNLTVINDRIFVFNTIAGQKADVFINSKKIGQTPLTLTFEEIKNNFNPELTPNVWPPPGINGGSEGKHGDYTFSMLEKSASIQKGNLENIIYIQEKKGSVIKTLGGFNVKLETSDGKIGILSGGGGQSESGIFKRDGNFVKGHQDKETLHFICETPTKVKE